MLSSQMLRLCATGLGPYNSPDVTKFSFLPSGFSSSALKANAFVEKVGPKKIMRKIQVAPSKFIFRHLSSPPCLFVRGEGAGGVSSSILAGIFLSIYPVVFFFEKFISYFSEFFDK